MYKLRLPVGDWSGDGHSQCEYFILSSNVSSEELTAIFTETCKRTKKNPKQICHDYEDNEVKWKDLEEMGLDPTPLFKEMDDYDEDEEETDEIIGSACARDMAKIMIAYLTTHNPNLRLELLDDDAFPIVHALSTGYGCFN
jgi:hypothetical protein